MVSHVPLYQFYEQIRMTPEQDELIEYMIHRRVALWIQDEKHITHELMESDGILMDTIAEYQRMSFVRIL